MNTTNEIPSILEDEREIKRIVWPDDSCRTVGEDCDKIAPYKEKSWGPWLAIYQDGAIIMRVSAARLIVMYELPLGEKS